MGRRYSPTDDLRDLRNVVADRDLSTAERMVMVALILHRNGETGRIDPSVPSIAAESGLGRRTVIRALGELEERGRISREQRRGVRTRYTVAPTSGTVAPVPERHQCQPVTGVMPQRHQGSATVAPERTKNETKERTNKIAAEMWAIFQAEMDGERLMLTDSRSKKLLALHREQLASEPDPLALFRRTLAAVKASPHHMGERAYQMPESLFQSPERRERWAEAGRRNGHRPRERDPLMLSTRELWEREGDGASHLKVGSTHPTREEDGDGE